MSKRIRIVGDHPHKGESGTVRDDKPMLMGMYLIDLDNGYTASGCYVDPKNLKPLSRDEDPYV